MVDRREGRKRGGTSYGEKTNLLIDRFRRLDGEPWRGAEIERESGERISTGYFSALRKDRIKNPGDDALEVIAHVVGFPPKLWELEPEEWEREVEKTRLLAEKERQAAGIPGRGVRLVDDDPGAEKRYGETHEAGEVAVRLDRLFENLINPRTGEPYDAYSVAALSEGLLTEGEVGEMRAGDGGPVRWVKLVALSNAFDISPDYWLIPLEAQDQLEVGEAIKEFLEKQEAVSGMHRSHNLSEDRDMLASVYHLVGKYLKGRPPQEK